MIEFSDQLSEDNFKLETNLKCNDIGH